ncbi:MAG: lysophospholipase [Chitinophagaceae bacterium]
MKLLFFIFAVVVFSFSLNNISINMPKNKRSYLALGDSYTIGEAVESNKNFPHQLVEILKQKGFDFAEPEIIAKTGWTTDELQVAILKHELHPPYDLVTLLIGVNNQYRGRSAEEYSAEFESLLKQAIQFAGEKNDHVIVLSIPDWGVTPYAEGRDRKKIAEEIDEFNRVNQMISKNYGVHYLDITPGTREAENDHSFLTTDGLHPSAKEYKRWAEKIADLITKNSYSGN